MLFPTETATTICENDRSVIKSGKATNVEEWFTSPSNRRCYIASRSVLSDKKGYIEGSIINITDRKEVEQSLRESETRFKALHNASFGGIAIHDKGIILECNQGLCDMMGYKMPELIGMDGLLLIA